MTVTNYSNKFLQIIGNSEFKKGDVIMLKYNRECLRESAIGINRIPSLDEAMKISKYYYISEDGDTLYYITQLKADCDQFTISIERYQKATIIEIGKNYFFNLTRTMIKTKDRYSSIQLTSIKQYDNEYPIPVYSSNNNFQSDDHVSSFYLNDTEILYTKDLKPDYWYFEIISTKPCGFSFESNYKITPFESPITVYRQLQSFDLIYHFPAIDCICYETNETNINFQFTSIPGAGDSSQFPYFNKGKSLFVISSWRVCIPQFTSPVDQVLLLFKAEFNSFDFQQNITFFNITQNQVQSETWTHLPMNKISYYQVTNETEWDGGVLLLDTDNCPDLELWVTQDDGWRSF